MDYIANQLVKAIMPKVQSKSGSKNVKPFQVKSHMCLFINCLIENPSFDSQTKETMTLRASSFGSTYTLSPKFIKDGNIKEKLKVIIETMIILIKSLITHQLSIYLFLYFYEYNS